jgi:hypothetical protein
MEDRCGYASLGIHGTTSQEVKEDLSGWHSTVYQEKTIGKWSRSYVEDALLQALENLHPFTLLCGRYPISD